MVYTCKTQSYWSMTVLETGQKPQTPVDRERCFTSLFAQPYFIVTMVSQQHSQTLPVLFLPFSFPLPFQQKVIPQSKLQGGLFQNSCNSPQGRATMHPMQGMSGKAVSQCIGRPRSTGPSTVLSLDSAPLAEDRISAQVASYSAEHFYDPRTR